MFQKNNELETGIVYFESFLKSAKDMKEFLSALRRKFEMDESSTVWDILDKVEQLFSEWIKVSAELDTLKEAERYDDLVHSKLLSELVTKELVANVANYGLFEIMSVIKQLVNEKNSMSAEAYYSYVDQTLQKLQDLDPLKKKDILQAHIEEIARLRENLTNKIEALAKLKLEIAETISNNEVVGLETFDRDFNKFKAEYALVKIKAAKFDFLVKRGAIKEVGDSISSMSQFHINYKNG